jgi:hypothetical protein
MDFCGFSGGGEWSGFFRLSFWYRGGDEGAVELDDGWRGERLPLESDSVARRSGVKEGYGWRCCSCGGECRFGEACGTPLGVEDADAVGESGGRVGCQGGGERVCSS